ncbi:MAG: sensor histidine kinase [Niabella sp.]
MAYKQRDKNHLIEKRQLEEDFNHQLLRSQIEVQEQTFQQIGKELHDNVGQLLSTSRMLIGITERNLETPPDTLLTANATIGKAITELRALSKSLDKEWLEQFNFIQNLTTEIDRINAGNQIKATLHCKESLKLPPAKTIILFRIVQEAIQNAVKHGHCKHIDMRIDKENHIIQIAVKDDGKGFDIEKITKGMGLSNMQHRTNILNGTVKYDSRKNKGTAIHIAIPEC